MNILIFLLMISCNALAVNASFFTWVAQTINPVFNKLFPEAYHPRAPKTLPEYRRLVKNEYSDKPMDPPRFYIDQNNTIRGLMPRKHATYTRRGGNFRGVKSQSRMLTGVTRPAQTFTNLTCDECVGKLDKYMFTPDRVRCHGYVADNFTVHTEDGYILTIFRISPPEKTREFREPVLLHHGLLGSSDDWVILGQNKSLVYKLLDAGYDVWLTNARGNIYSRGHKNKKSTSYWMFSWQEIGQYDLPAVIDHIELTVKKESKREHVQLNYIGHSMGATALLVLLSAKPRYNDIIRMAILLAPLAFMNKELHHLQEIARFSAKYPNNMLDVLGDGLSMPYKELPSWWIDDFDELCVSDSASAMCTNALFFIAGPVLGAWDPCLRADVLRHVPAGGSVDTITHYAQSSLSNSFQQFNGSEFELGRVTSPVAIMCSKTDALSTEGDAHKLFLNLANPITYQVIRSFPFSHTEFVWDALAGVLVYNKVLALLRSGLELQVSADG